MLPCIDAGQLAAVVYVLCTLNMDGVCWLAVVVCIANAFYLLANALVDMLQRLDPVAHSVNRIGQQSEMTDMHCGWSPQYGPMQGRPGLVMFGFGDTGCASV